MEEDIQRFIQATMPTVDGYNIENFINLYHRLNGHINMLYIRNLATRYKNFDVLDFFYDQGVDMYTLFEDRNPIMIAIEEEFEDYVDSQWDREWNWDEIVDYIIKHYIDINSFSYACWIGDIEKVKKLYHIGIDDVNLLLGRNLCVKNDNVDILHFLYQQGVDVDSIFLNTNPLIIASKYGYDDIIDYLLYSKLHNVDVNRRGGNGSTALIFAALYGQENIIDKLLETGKCDVNITDIRLDNIALYYAVSGDNLNIVDKLIFYGSDVFHINVYGETLLHNAAISSNSKIVKRILSLGLDINDQDGDLNTPLMIAVKNGRYENVKILLENGAKINIADYYWKFPWEYASSDEIRNILREYM